MAPDFEFASWGAGLSQPGLGLTTASGVPGGLCTNRDTGFRYRPGQNGYEPPGTHCMTLPGTHGTRQGETGWLTRVVLVGVGAGGERI